MKMANQFVNQVFAPNSTALVLMGIANMKFIILHIATNIYLKSVKHVGHKFYVK